MNRKVTVLINYHGKRGSGPSYSLEWAKGLIKNNCDVYAVISKEVVNLSEWEALLPSERIFLIDTHKDYSRIDLIKKTLKLYLIEKKQIQKQFNNVTFDFSFHTFYCHWANIVDSFLNVNKVVAICHDPIAHSGTKLYTNYLFYRHYKKADYVFTLTKSFVPLVHERFGIPLDHIHYIPHGRMQMYNHYSQVMYESLHYSSEKINFLFFGFIEDYKGLNILANAYKIVSSKRNNITLTIAGNGNFGPYKKAYDGLKNLNIINRYIKDEEVGALFAGPNVIVILPYTNATQSGVIPIAYEFLTPIIASNTGGLKEQLDDGKIGYMFEAGNSNELADKMIYLIDNPQKWEEQNQIMKDYRKKLDWDVLATQLLNEIGE